MQQQRCLAPDASGVSARDEGVDWGALYNRFKDAELDTDELEKQVANLMMDDDVERKPESTRTCCMPMKDI
jgi:hypothetical protein